MKLELPFFDKIPLEYYPTASNDVEGTFIDFPFG